MDDNGHDWLTKLEILKELKVKHDDLKDLRKRILDGHNLLKDTEKWLDEFKGEVEVLEQEKQKHTEIIRLINKDLEEMNTIIKGTEADRQKLSRDVKHLVDDFVPVKDDVDRMRRCMDMEPTHNSQEERMIISSMQPDRPEVPQTFPGIMQPNSEAFAFHNHMPMSFNHQSAPMMANSGLNQHSLNIANTGMGFRQKPAPMKICPNCTSEIHRNAPICPTCKSKSHSKNPKKSKKKAVS